MRERGQAPGQWQTLYIRFRAPRFDKEGRKIAHARFEKVVLNGQLIHDHVDVAHPTGDWRDGACQGATLVPGRSWPGGVPPYSRAAAARGTAAEETTVAGSGLQFLGAARLRRGSARADRREPFSAYARPCPHASGVGEYGAVRDSPPRLWQPAAIGRAVRKRPAGVSLRRLSAVVVLRRAQLVAHPLVAGRREGQGANAGVPPVRRRSGDRRPPGAHVLRRCRAVDRRLAADIRTCGCMCWASRWEGGISIA